jgi:hypothetical protein
VELSGHPGIPTNGACLGICIDDSCRLCMGQPQNECASVLYVRQRAGATEQLAQLRLQRIEREGRRGTVH